RALPLRAARRSGGVRDAGLVPALEDAGADARQVLATAPRCAPWGERERPLAAPAAPAEALRRMVPPGARGLPQAPRARRGRRRTALYPSTSFAFLPADMVSQILNFGLPAPIDVQVSGFNVEANRAYAQALLARLHRIPGVVDLRIQQAFDYPQLNVEVDRSK